MMARAGQLGIDILDLSHAELIAWLDDVAQSLGIKMCSTQKITNGQVIISQRRKPPVEKSTATVS